LARGQRSIATLSTVSTVFQGRDLTRLTRTLAQLSTGTYYEMRVVTHITHRVTAFILMFILETHLYTGHRLSLASRMLPFDSTVSSADMPAAGGAT